ncbi:MAG: transcriptional repressor [Bacteroidales bacterium]|nr:transcriptional repressor [Bacteroidales bacterium]
MNNNYEINKTVKKIFTEYLKKNEHRKTPERYKILREIYSTDGHFNVETLFIRMNKNKYRISRATLYNTIELLLNCNLVTKHQFGNTCAQYERSYRSKQHDHFVNIEDGKVLEFFDPKLQDIKKSVEKLLNVKITHHSLTFYGNSKNKKNINHK